MIEVTQADRNFAAYWIAQSVQSFSERSAYRKEIEAGEHDAHPMVIAAATHRIEAAKAERDRLRNLPDDVMVEVMESFNNGLIKKADPTNPRGFVTYYDPLQASRNLVTALADALEGEHP